MSKLQRFKLLALAGAIFLFQPALTQLRPPAVPLVTSDPYLSIWSESNHLYDSSTVHWTHVPIPLTGYLRVDGHLYRVMGRPRKITNQVIPQSALQVTPTSTTYTFKNQQVQLKLSFLTPLLPSDLEVYSRPITYVTWKVASVDGKSHSVQIFEGTGAAISVNQATQKVVWARKHWGPLTVLKVGTQAQTLLSPAGDDVRIDWGYGYTAANSARAVSGVAPINSLLEQFRLHGHLDGVVSASMPRSVKKGETSLGFSFDLGWVGSHFIQRQVMIGYDEGRQIDYFGNNLLPYWRKFGDIKSTFLAAHQQYSALKDRCHQFDARLTNSAIRVGGSKYSQIIALAYRECVAATGLVEDANHQPLLFTKEDTSNGDIATVDVIFPMDPIWVLLSPELAKASLQADFEYAASPHWKFPNAPHDLGTYPQVFGRDDGGEGMPVEESGNMIILTDAIAHAEGSAEYAKQWWPQLTQWAKYLVQYGLDPEDQLCTDDFMGHLAHNANLSIKAILALAAYGDLCKMKGDFASAKHYKALAHADAVHWMTVAEENGHSLLAFDKPNTWSQKYNLAWDQILNLHVFPKTLAKSELRYYLTKLNRYGLPLDSRTTLSKTDWTIWSASMAGSKSEFEKFINPIYRYLNTTTSRDPVADSYITTDPHSNGMHARPVVGGFFIRFLDDPAVWKSWSHQVKTRVIPWAPIPKPPVIHMVVPTSQVHGQIWRYTTTDPGSGWNQPQFDDSTWQSGPGGFGTEGTPNAVVGTTWNTDDIWIRRTVTLPHSLTKKEIQALKISVYHDEDVQVYFNGVLAFTQPGYVNQYQVVSISAAAKKQLKAGATLHIAVHCHQTTGGQGVDVGICTETLPN